MGNNAILMVLILMSVSLSLSLLTSSEVYPFISKALASTTPLQPTISQNPSTSERSAENSNNPVGTSSYSTYRNPSFGVELLYPNSWKILESTDEESPTIVTFVPPGEENAFQYLVTFSIQVFTADKDDDLSESLEQTISLYKNDEDVYDDFEIVGQSTITDKIGGYPAYSLTGTYNYDGKDYKLADWGFKVEETEFDFVYDSESQKFEKYYPDIRKMVESFKLY
jgi:hypothetical protein